MLPLFLRDSRALAATFLSCTLLVVPLLSVPTAGAQEAPAASAASSAPDPRAVEAQALQRFLMSELREESDEVFKAVRVDVAPIGGELFGVFLSGRVEAGLKATLVALVERKARERGYRVRVYPVDLKEGDAPPPPPKKRTRTEILHYLRDASAVALLVDTVINKGATPKPLQVTAIDGNRVVLSGDADLLHDARRIIAVLDVPRSGIGFSLLGVQLSSNNPERLAKVVKECQDEIAVSRAAVKKFLQNLTRRARQLEADRTFKDDFASVGFPHILEKLDAQYLAGLSEVERKKAIREKYRNYSLVDVALRLLASQNFETEIPKFANELDGWMGGGIVAGDSSGTVPTPNLPVEQYRVYKKRWSGAEAARPLARFWAHFGLKASGDHETGFYIPEYPDAVKEHVEAGRAHVLEFARHYARTIDTPQSFSPYDYHLSVEGLEPTLRNALLDLGNDVTDLFVVPTIEAIRKKAQGNVSFAHVGRTTVNTLNDSETEVTGEASNAFPSVSPLEIGQLVADAKTIKGNLPTLPANAPVLGGIPVGDLIGLFGALQKDRTTWQGIATGASIKFTPHVLRSGASAEVAVEAEMGDPKVNGPAENGGGAPTFSRITQHHLKSRVYLDALDMFALSSFEDQATLSGGRTYVPLLGTVWRGIFGEIPAIGKLFSWPNPPKTRYHVSLLVASTVIVPTTTGVAYLYPLGKVEREEQSPAAAMEQATEEKRQMDSPPGTAPK